jgi:hypothetical protein
MKFGPFDSVALLKPHLDAPRWALVEAWLARDKKTAEEATISSLRDDLKGEDLYLWIGEGGERFEFVDYKLVTYVDEVEVDE